MVLLISLIILVALSLGGIALVRQIGTTNFIVGNLAFQQAATMSGELGMEEAIRSFEVGRVDAMNDIELQSDKFSKGYAATANFSGPPENAADWESHWRTTVDPVPKSIPVSAKSCGHGSGRACTLPTDDVGNTVSYTIQRLCKHSGEPALSGCVSDPPQEAPGASLGVGKLPMSQMRQYYYRITARVSGPRNTVSFVQTIVTR